MVSKTTLYMRKWRAKNKERINAKKRELRKLNPEKYREYERQKWDKNKDKYNAKRNLDRKNNIDAYREKEQAYRNLNREKLYEYNKTFYPLNRIWRKNNRKLYKVYKANRRALEKDLTLDVVQRVYENNIKTYGTLTCILCDKKIKFKEDSLEHLQPLSRGGSNKYENLGISHINCNKRKGRRTLEEYLKQFAPG